MTHKNPVETGPLLEGFLRSISQGKSVLVFARIRRCITKAMLPMRFSCCTQGHVLIARIQAALDVMDLFACRTLSEIVQIIRLRGADTVIVGIQSEIALAVIRMGLKLEGGVAAFGLERGLAFLNQNSRMRDGRLQ